jgi:hypothetical protein
MEDLLGLAVVLIGAVGGFMLVIGAVGKNHSLERRGGFVLLAYFVLQFVYNRLFR